MAQRSPLRGWTPYAALTNLSTTHDRGTIADTPCKGFQWVYLIKQDDLAVGLHTWTMSFRIYRRDGETLLFESTLELPILITPGGGDWPAIWSIKNHRVRTTYPTDFATWMGEAEQPDAMPLNNGNLPVFCEVYSAHYLVPLPAGALWDVTFHNVGTPDLRFAPIETSVSPLHARKRMLLDPVSADQYLPRIENEMLVMRAQIHDGPTGPRSGLAISYASGRATVTAGTAVIGYRELTADDALSVAVPTSGTHYVFLSPATQRGKLQLVVGDGPQTGPAWCLGRVKSGRLATCSGVLIADGVDVVAVDRREDGILVVRYDAGDDEDLVRVSRDRGVTWETE